jgi:hypothetical protein
VRVALVGSVDSTHAPVPRSDAERLVFRQLYETLVRVDCSGRLTPGLAESWVSSDSGRRWTFTLRRGAQFWDGVPVTARDVLASWRARDTALAGVPWADSLSAAVTIGGEHTLNVRLREADDTLPRRFALPALAVAKLVPGLAWPLGTGKYWLNTSDGRRVASPAFGDSLPAIVFRSGSGGDPRDLLDAGTDVLVTDDAAVLGYAGSRDELTSAPLPWERTYVLIRRVDSTAAPLGDFQAGLARDAVRVEARPAAGAVWWEDRSRCSHTPVAPAGAVSTAPLSRIAYLRGDETARDLANRLVALGAAGPPSITLAEGMPAQAFAAALRTGAVTGYVVALPTLSLQPCADMRALVNRAPWLDTLPAGHIVPLVDTRRRAIVRRPGLPLATDWDGVPRLR